MSAPDGVDMYPLTMLITAPQGAFGGRILEAFVRQGLMPPQPVVETLSPVTVAALVREDPSLIGLARYESARQCDLLAGVRRLPIVPQMQLPPLCLITRRGPAGATELLQAFVDSVRCVTESSR